MIVQIQGKQAFKTQLGEANDEVIIGSDKSASFVPQIEFKKWKNSQTQQYENSLTIKPSGQLALDLADATPTLTSGKLEIRKDKIGWYANPDGEENFKFGLILYEKPATNTWNFQLEGWEEFDFFYQKPWENPKSVFMTTEESPWGVAGEHYIKTDKDKKGSVRQAKADGSYAVYHKTKKNHIIGQTNYQTGKAFHIYRSKFTDAEGKWEWADLHIENGVMTETISQAFLNTAIYPLKSNADLGYDTKGAGGSDTSWDFDSTMDTADQTNTIVSMSMYLKHASATGHTFNLGYYLDNGLNDIGVHIAHGTAETVGVIDTWKTIAVSGAVTNGLIYFLAGQQEGDLTDYYDTLADVTEQYAATFTFDDWSNNPTAPSSYSDTYVSIYATYTSGGAPANEATQLIMVM